MKNKKAGVLQSTLIHIVLIGLIAAIFLISNGQRIDSRYTKQQIVEKQLALFIDSAIPGMEFTIMKTSGKSHINKLEIIDNRIYATLNSLPSANGYPIFSQHNIEITETDFVFRITITE